MTEEPDLTEGWGVHIIEGLDKTLVWCLVFLFTVAAVVINVCLSKWEKQSVNWGQLYLGIVAIAVSFFTSAFYWQRDN